MSATREKFSSQADPEVLAELRRIARQEGRQFQAVLDQAMREYIERKSGAHPRRHVLDALRDSLEDFDDLYRELAK